MWVHGRDVLGDPNREYPSLVERLTQSRVIDAQVTRDRVEPELGRALHTLDGALDLVEQGQHIPGIAWIALRDQVGKDTTSRRLRHQPGFTAKLHWAIALTFEEGGDGGILGIDHFTMAQLLALGALPRLGADVLMGAHRHGQLPCQAFA